MIFLVNQTDDASKVLLTLPLAKKIKIQYPKSKIVFLVTVKSAELLTNHPYVDEYRIYHRHAKFFYKIKEIFRIFNEVSPTHYLYAGGGYLPNFFAWINRLQFRGGLKSRWHTYLFLNKGVRQKRSMVTMHEVEYNLNLLSPLGLTYDFKERSSFLPEFFLSEHEKETNINRFKKNIAVSGIEPEHKMIVIHPGMVENNLNWSARNYARLILKYEQRFPNKFLFVVSFDNQDFSFLQNFKEIINRRENEFLKTRVHYLNTYEFGLKYYLSVLSSAILFVGPNNVNTHYASLLGVPVVTLYSPIKNHSALRWGPLSGDKEKLKVLVPDVICGEHLECALKECPYYECMGKIEVEDVLKQSLILIDI